MEESPHVLLSAKSAELFAKEHGLKIVSPHYFFDERRWDNYKRKKRKEESSPEEKDKGMFIELDPDESHGTVGAVAVDIKGNLAAATSTGGSSFKRWGRIGDSPIIGASTYANNNTCAVSTTGKGEYFMRGVVAFDISAMMEYKGASLQQAADHVIKEKLKDLDGKGGCIAVDKDGNIAMPYISERMYRGYIRKDGEMHVWIYEKM